MKRQKRNPDHRAMAKGYRAGAMGKSRTNCPYMSGAARFTWLSGWREGREDLWNGYNAVVQEQRVSNM